MTAFQKRPHSSASQRIRAPSAVVFELLHDYNRRLEWDTLLQEAYLTDNWTAADLHATTVCRGRSILGGIAMKTEYVSFNPPHVAAVKLVNRPPFFETFAATIRHRDLDQNESEIEYIYTFTARPRWLQWLLHPIMNRLLQQETKKRLQSLARFLEQKERP